jgi:multidrug efflux system outer membrane protein
MNPSVRSLGTLAAVLALLPGCSVTPSNKASNVTLPVSWRNAADFPTASPEKDLSTWWSSFGDPQMTRLIREALAGNRDVASAVARVRQAQAQRDAQRASLFPSVGYDGSRSSGTGWIDDGGRSSFT